MPIVGAIWNCSTARKLTSAQPQGPMELPQEDGWGAANCAQQMPACLWCML